MKQSQRSKQRASHLAGPVWKGVVCGALLWCAGGVAKAQTSGTYSGYSPYSMFGVGELHPAGSSWNRGMGGIGLAARSNRFLNLANPAAVTARDSLAFMADVGLGGSISVFGEGGKNNLSSVCNLEDLALSFPLWKKAAMMVSLTPASDVGYAVSNTFVDAYAGFQTQATQGSGGLYQVALGVGMLFWDRLSVGAQGVYYFGTIDRSTACSAENSAYLSFHKGDSLRIHSFSGRLGAQYEQPLPSGQTLTLGAVCKFSSRMHGTTVRYLQQGSLRREREEEDLSGHDYRLGGEWGAGLSWKQPGKWSVELDATWDDWSASHMEDGALPGFACEAQDATFTASTGTTFRLGAEWCPNRGDIRYYLKRCTYRAGISYGSAWYRVNGEPVRKLAVTAGITLPVFRWHNGLTVGLEYGRRGLRTDQIRQNYFAFSVGFNIFDIWFQKPQYE